MRTYRCIPNRLAAAIKNRIAQPKGVLTPEYGTDWLVQEELPIVPLPNGQTTDWFFVAKGTKAEMLDLLKVLEAKEWELPWQLAPATLHKVAEQKK